MKTALKIAGIFACIIGGQALILGALYKIQSWGPPDIAGREIDLLTMGTLLTIGGVALLVVIKLKQNREMERLDLKELPLAEDLERPSSTPIKEEDLLL